MYLLSSAIEMSKDIFVGEKKNNFALDESLKKLLKRGQIELGKIRTDKSDIEVILNTDDNALAPSTTRALINEQDGIFFVDLSNIVVPLRTFVKMLGYKKIKNVFDFDVHPRDKMFIDYANGSGLERWVFVHFVLNETERLHIIGLDREDLIAEEIQVPDDSELNDVHISDVLGWMRDAQNGLIYKNFS